MASERLIELGLPYRRRSTPEAGLEKDARRVCAIHSVRLEQRSAIDHARLVDSGDFDDFAVVEANLVVRKRVDVAHEPRPIGRSDCR